LDLSDSLIF
jgi:regulator of replication initiation timing